MAILTLELTMRAVTPDRLTIVLEDRDFLPKYLSQLVDSIIRNFHIMFGVIRNVK